MPPWSRPGWRWPPFPRSSAPTLGLLLVVGEEENGDGSLRFLEETRPDWVVIGEPTSLLPAFSHFGYMEVALVTRGRRIHSSLPELGHNAIESMLRVLLQLAGAPLFTQEPSQLVYSIREMSSSRAGFVVPDRCETLIDLHLPPRVNPADMRRELEAILDSARVRIKDLDLEASFDFEAGGYQLDVDNRLYEVLEAVYPRLNLPLESRAVSLPFRRQPVLSGRQPSADPRPRFP